jgi:DNA-binding transcriptional LysR family regulator
MDKLHAIATFARVADLGSFNQAAVAQGLTPQAVSKTIRELERHLGVRLFHRTTRKSSLTIDGQQFLESVKPSLEGMLGALTRARQSAGDDEGLIRISAARCVGSRVLLPLIADFQLRYPKVEIELVLEERITDIVAERIDVGFRAGAQPEGHVIARRLFAIQQIVCASPAYLARHGEPLSLAQLAEHRCVGYRHPSTGRLLQWEFDLDGEYAYRDMHPCFCCNDAESELMAVTQGIGIGLLDGINAAADLRAGRLIALLSALTSDRIGLYLYYPQRSDMPTRVRHFIDFAVSALQDCSAFYLERLQLESLRATHLP